MPLARRLLIAALICQAAGSALVLLQLGLEDALAALTLPDIALVTVAIGAVSSGLLLVPVRLGRRWGIAASVPVLAAMLGATFAAFAPILTAPSLIGFANWLTVAVVLVTAAAGIPIAIAAYIEAGAGSSSADLAASGPLKLARFSAVAAATALIGMTVLAVVVAASPAGPPPVADELTGEVVRLTMRDLRFEPETLRLPGGVTTTVEIVNQDDYEHSFDVDELGAHVLVSGGQTARVQLTPGAGDVMRLYCAIGGHVELGMVGEVVGD